MPTTTREGLLELWAEQLESVEQNLEAIYGPPGITPTLPDVTTKEGMLEAIADKTEECLQGFYDVLNGYDTVTGNPVTISDAINLPVKDISVDIVAVQDTSGGDPSLTNVCPITGWKSVHVTKDGTDYAIDWTDDAGTVYGGTIDMTTGVLTVTHAGRVFDGTETWQANSGYNFYLASGKGSGSGVTTDGRYSHWVYTGINSTSSDTTKMPSAYIWTTGNLNVQRADIDHTPEAMQEWCLEQYEAGTPFTIMYPLDTPKVYTLDSVQIRTTEGTNVFEADTGDVTIVYAKDYKT